MASERKRESTNAPALPLRSLERARGEDEQLRTRVVWLLLFRAAVVTVLLVTSLLLRATTDESMFARVAVALYGLAAASYASVLAGGLVLRAFGTRYLRELAYGQLLFDGAIATVIVMLTGGVESVFVFVYSLSILNGAAVLQSPGARSVGIASAVYYSLVFVAQASGVFVPFGFEARPVTALLAPYFTNAASFVLVALLAGYLTDQLRRTSERLDVAQRHIEDLEDLYGAVLESLPSGVLTVDEGGTVVYINTAGADILGTRPSALLGRPLGVLASALAEEIERDAHQRFERAALVEGRARTIGGSVARLTGVEDITGRVIVFQDLTELRSLQAHVARAERLGELGRFAAGLAHEIRNPLAAMIGCLQLLQADDAGGARADDERARMLGIVHREAQRLSALVSEFLTYARPAPPRVGPTDVAAVVDETIESARQALPGLALARTGDARLIAACDSDQLRQVLWNLVTNAGQAIQGAGSGSRVDVGVERVGDRCVISVDDDGPGVPGDIAGRIFEPFFTTRPEGTGLGLATSHQLIAQQGGDLRFVPSARGGARFEIVLPVADATAVLELDGAGRLAGAS